MSTIDRIHWLHLSDFHTGKDDYAQIQLFQSIITKVDEIVHTDGQPDFVILSGDLANSGKVHEYEFFYEEFVFPLLELLNNESHKIIAIPGNHDVDQSKAEAVRRYGILNDIPALLDPTESAMEKRRPLFPRFQAFADNDLSVAPPHWLFSSKGILVKRIEKSSRILGCVRKIENGLVLC